MAYIVIPEEEYELRSNEIRMTAMEVSELLEEQDIVIKWLKKNINRIQSQLAMCNLQGKEQEAYISINTIKNLIKDLEETGKNYKDYLNQLENKKSQ